MNAVIVYMSYVLYTTSHKGSFPYLPNKQIMDYTMNNLSNRYLIKQVGTIQGMIEQTVINAINGRYEKDLQICSDIYIKDILSALETRMSSVIKYIAQEYYKNHESGAYLFHEEDSEDENNYHISDNLRRDMLPIKKVIASVPEYNLNFFSLNAFDTTKSELKLIAIAPIIGERSRPNAG